MLPVTDQVALVLDPGGTDSEVVRVPWKALVQIAGDCLAPERNLDPPRWRTTRWPDSSQWAKLLAIAG